MDSSEVVSQVVREKALALPDQAKEIRIVDTISYTQAAEFLKAVKSLRAEVAAAFNPTIEAAHNAHKVALAQKKSADGPLDDAERIVKVEMVRYDNAQELQRREEQARLEAEARRLEEERRLAEAVALADSGDTASADEILAEPFIAPVIQMPKAVPKVQGISYSEVWRFRIVDSAKIPREYLVPDETKIGGVVRAMKGATNIPGIQAYAEKIARSGR